LQKVDITRRTLDVAWWLWLGYFVRLKQYLHIFFTLPFEVLARLCGTATQSFYDQIGTLFSLKQGSQAPNGSEGQMRTYKATREPHYHADATMAVAEPYRKQLLHLISCERYREFWANH